MYAYVFAVTCRAVQPSFSYIFIQFEYCSHNIDLKWFINLSRVITQTHCNSVSAYVIPKD